MTENHWGHDSPSSKIANTSAGRASTSTAFLKRTGAVSKNDASTGWQGKDMATSSLARGGAAVEAQHDDLGLDDLRRPGEVREAGRHRDLLRAVRRVGDHAAADAAAEILAPEFLAAGGIERIEVAAHVAEEHDPSGRRSHAADDRVVGLQAPFPDAGVGVDGVDPPGPVSFRTAHSAEYPERVPRRHSGPWLPEFHRPQFRDGLRRDRVAPVNLADENEIGRRNVGRAVPFRAPDAARAEIDVL